MQPKTNMTMEKQHLQAAIQVANAQVKASLEVYLFEEEGTRIAYCPALNLSAYGTTLEDAKSEFAQILKEYLEDCIRQDTLIADLSAHGWKIQPKKYVAPIATDMLIANETLRDIVNNRVYRKMMLPTSWRRSTRSHARA